MYNHWHELHLGHLISRSISAQQTFCKVTNHQRILVSLIISHLVHKSLHTIGRISSKCTHTCVYCFSSYCECLHIFYRITSGVFFCHFCILTFIVVAHQLVVYPLTKMLSPFQYKQWLWFRWGAGDRTRYSTIVDTAELKIFGKSLLWLQNCGTFWNLWDLFFLCQLSLPCRLLFQPLKDLMQASKAAQLQ